EGPFTERTGQGRRHEASILAVLDPQQVQPLVLFQRPPAHGVGLVRPQPQAQQQRLPARLGPAGDQPPARRLPLRLAPGGARGGVRRWKDTAKPWWLNCAGHTRTRGLSWKATAPSPGMTMSSSRSTPIGSTVYSVPAGATTTSRSRTGRW